MTTQHHAPQYPQPSAVPHPYPVPHPGVAPPGYAVGPVAPAGPAAVPNPVRIAFWLLIAQILFSAINTLLIVAALVAGGGSAVLGVTTYSGSPILFVVGFVLGNGLWALLATMMLKGHNWARIVITVLVALGVVSTLFTIMSGILFLLTGLASLGLGIAAVVLMYRRDAGPWFAQR